MEVKGTTGNWVSVVVYFVTDKPHGSTTLSIIGGGSGVDKFGNKAIIVQGNATVTPKMMMGAARSGVLEGMIYDTLLHELTHIADEFPSKTQYKVDPGSIRSEAEIDLVAYYNDPKEIRAYTQEIADETVERLKRWGERIPFNRAFKMAIKASRVWDRIEPHLTERNKRYVWKAVWAAMQDELEDQLSSSM